MRKNDFTNHANYTHCRPIDGQTSHQSYNKHTEINIIIISYKKLPILENTNVSTDFYVKYNMYISCKTEASAIQITPFKGSQLDAFLPVGHNLLLY